MRAGARGTNEPGAPDERALPPATGARPRVRSGAFRREKSWAPAAVRVSCAEAVHRNPGPVKKVPRRDRVPSRETPSLAIGGSAHSRPITSRTGNTFYCELVLRRGGPARPDATLRGSARVEPALHRGNASAVPSVGAPPLRGRAHARS